MISDEVVVVKDLSKAYAVYKKPADIFLELVTRRQRHNLFWALKDISFSIKNKQRLGIIGPNGSGKTTLLRIIAGNLDYTSGSRSVNAKISAMLSLASSLHPEETGLQNIEFNLLIGGCPKEKVKEKTEEVIEFTELGPFIYQPVKTYSSGMAARLSFAITTAFDPELLVVDEVLGVGDAHFVGKAVRRMKALCEKGKALIYVSHSIPAIQMLCDTVLWLDNGAMRMMGPVDYVAKQYEEEARRRMDEELLEGNIEKRKRITNVIQESSMDTANVYRIRIVSDTAKGTLRDTHYIRDIRLDPDGGPSIPVPLNLTSEEKTPLAANLDFFGSEWGRLFSKTGDECRLLCASPGRARGGHILYKPAKGLVPESLEISFFRSSLMGNETLRVEIADIKAGRWKAAELVEIKGADRGWAQYRFRASLPAVTEQDQKASLEKLRTMTRPDVTVERVSLVAAGEECHVLHEGQKFEIQVRIMANRPTSQVCVNLRIDRADGVYVFWQPSGWNGHNIHDLKGEATVRFCFDKNPLCGGDYQVSATTASEWDPENYPFREVFDRKVHALSITVLREFPEIDFGQVNIKVPVIVDLSSGN